MRMTIALFVRGSCVACLNVFDDAAAAAAAAVIFTSANLIQKYGSILRARI